MRKGILAIVNQAASSLDPETAADLVRRLSDEARLHLGRYAQATLALVNERFLLPEDVPAILRHGLEEWNETGR